MVHGGDNGKCLPTLHLLLLDGRVQNDADGEEVVDAFEGTFLLLHFLPDGVDGLCAALDVERQSSLRQSLFDGFDKPLDIGITALLGFTQLILDVVVSVVLHVFQRQVLQFRLQLIET